VLLKEVEPQVVPLPDDQVTVNSDFMDDSAPALQGNEVYNGKEAAMA